ncbi:hypothetical protein ACIA8K_25135 [Catenuloplanes sp. NPDC051500]|uniref:hypothetical protein n=1 Tax=Catenuloplanes sp. NPDC051500 TaxID=3363959 RepID=UPI0037AE3EBB
MAVTLPGLRAPDRRPSVPATVQVPSSLAGKGYGCKGFRAECHRRGTEPTIPRRGRKHIKGLGRLRYVVEQGIALLHQFRRPGHPPGTPPPRSLRQPRLRPHLLVPLDHKAKTKIVLKAQRARK